MTISDRAAYDKLCGGRPMVWINPHILPFCDVTGLPLSADDISDAACRLRRFAPLVAAAFPETAADGGMIESPLREIPTAMSAMCDFGCSVHGRLFIKLDSELAVAGSVKARGGIYEVLCHAESIALEYGVISENDDYRILLDHKDLFGKYTVQVGSTGNLGLSIGISASALGFKTIVHMSADAKEWKKALLRSKGVEVREYSGDYSTAVAQGRALSSGDPKSYFVDDENSTALFLGYSTAAAHFKSQLDDLGVDVTDEHPLYVYLPCGVGGAPGGITFGLKHTFGDNVHCYFVEPTQCPSVAAGLITEQNENITVTDIGLSGATQADGLAVGRPSALVCRMMKPLVSGCVTADDQCLLPYLRMLLRTENIFIEPSSCIAFDALRNISQTAPAGANHVIWATGGSLVPEDIRQMYLV